MDLTFKYRDMISKNGCRPCGNKKFNEKYMPQFNVYITKGCPWCGGEGTMHEGTSGAVYVKCKSCGAFNPNVVDDGARVLGKSHDIDKDFDVKCKAAASRWNERVI